MWPRPDKSGGAPAKPAWSANPIGEDTQVKQPTQKVEGLTVNRVVNGYCSNCLESVGKDHTGCKMKCHKCREEGHRVADCPVGGASDKKAPAKAGKNKNCNPNNHSDKKAGNTGGARP